jgi:histidine triad (HIT) family protein
MLPTVPTGNSIALPDSSGCAFCAFLDGTKPYTILSRLDLVATLVTREQRGVAHLLVVPIRHCETILDVSDDEAAEIMKEVRRAARAIDIAHRRPGIAVWQNNGVPAHQTVPHVHVHVAGTVDGGSTHWGPVPRLSVADTDAIAAELRRTGVY